MRDVTSLYPFFGARDSATHILNELKQILSKSRLLFSAVSRSFFFENGLFMLLSVDNDQTRSKQADA